MLIGIETDILHEQVGIAERSKQRLSVRDLIPRYLAQTHTRKDKTPDAFAAHAQAQLRRIVREAPQIVELCLSDLTTTQVAKLREVLSRRYPAGTVSLTMAALSAALDWAVREGLLDRNPAIGVPRPQRPCPPLDFLSADDTQCLLREAQCRARTGEAAKFSHFVAVSLALRLGLRRGEIFGLRWEDVNLHTGHLTIVRSYHSTLKNNNPRYLRVPPPLLQLLREWDETCPQTPERLVCPTHYQGQWRMASQDADTTLPALLSAAGLGLKPHPWDLLRHTFASHFVMSGGSLVTLQKILGHTDLNKTLVYAHLLPDVLYRKLPKRQ